MKKINNRPDSPYPPELKKKIQDLDMMDYFQEECGHSNEEIEKLHQEVLTEIKEWELGNTG